MKKICVITSALSNHLLKRQRLQKKGLALLLASVLLITTGNAHAITATGVFNKQDLHGMYHDIHFQLATEFVVSMKYEATCRYPSNQWIELIRVADGYKLGYYGYTTDPDLTWKPLPLAPGNYVIRLRCMDEDFPLYGGDIPEYSLNYTSVAGASKYKSDSEPDDTEDDAIDLTKGQLIEGLLGYAGYPDLTRYPDGADIYYLNIPKDAKIKFKLEYDEALRDNPCASDPAGELELYLYYEINGSNRTFHDTWYFSGDVSEEITISAESPLAKLIVFGGCAGALYTRLLPKANYGGYRITIIVNGDEGPNAELGAIQDISTIYWDEASREYRTVPSLVPGEISKFGIKISNHGSSSIAATLIHGLSVKIGNEYGPTQSVGITQLNLPWGTTDVYQTGLKTPANTPIDVQKGRLVSVLYDSDNHILDSSQEEVDIWHPRQNAIILMPILQYILRK